MEKQYTLIITEKPSTALKIANSLSENGNAQKKMEGKVPVYQLNRNNKQIVVVPAAGHLYSLKPSQKGSSYPVFDIDWVPAYEAYEKSDFTKSYLKTIMNLSKKANEFVCATDYDIEGEVIAANILEFACKAKESKRMRFSTLTKEELCNSYDKSENSLDLNLVDAGRCRHKLDFFWGVSLSRALMSAIKKAGRFQVLSIGRVQGPSLAIIARRQNEITKFISVPYWQVFATIKDTIFQHKTDRFTDKENALKAVDESKGPGIVIQAKKSKVKLNPPFPFDLTTLQTEAYRAFGFTPTFTLQLAQQLYEQAYISYPRTSSQQLSEKLGLTQIVKEISKNPKYDKLALKLLSSGSQLVAHNGPKEDLAHPAIYPTGIIPKILNPQQEKLYDLIVKRFLTCFSKPAVRERNNVIVEFANQQYEASGSITLEENWIEFYSPYVKLEDEVISQFDEGEKVDARKIYIEEKQTQPPKHYTQASIVRKLEEENLGTKATRANIVQTLFDRGYVDGKSIQATTLGMRVFEALEKNAPRILEEKLTRHFEEEIEAITSAQKKSSEVIDEAKESLVKTLDEFKEKETDIGRMLLESLNAANAVRNTLGKCSCEGGSLLLRKSKFGFFVGCSRYPECKVTYPLPKGALIKGTNEVCEKCKTPIITVIRKGKRPWKMCLLPTCVTKASWAKKPESE